jgi:hypothetical protein
MLLFDFLGKLVWPMAIGSSSNGKAKNEQKSQTNKKSSTDAKMTGNTKKGTNTIKKGHMSPLDVDSMFDYMSFEQFTIPTPQDKWKEKNKNSSDFFSCTRMADHEDPNDVEDQDEPEDSKQEDDEDEEEAEAGHKALSTMALGTCNLLRKT